MKKISLIMLTVMIIAAMLSAGCNNYVTVGSYGNDNSKEKSLTYEKFSGSKQYTFTVNEGEKAVIDTAFVTVSGKLDVLIVNAEDSNDIEYQGNDIQTSTFILTISDAGKYVIKLEAENHKGSYSFIWE